MTLSKQRLLFIIGISFWLCTIHKVHAQFSQLVFSPKPGERIVFLGNTFADRMRHYNYFEVLLQKNFPTHNLTLRNMGWSGDEVGLQPRPLNFPGFGSKNHLPSSEKKEVSFEGYTYERGDIKMPVSLNFSGLNQDLTDQKADIIFLCFGMNEAFKGVAGLPQFEKDLDIFIENLLANRFKGRTAPRLVIISPIAHEKLGGHLPDPALHNENLNLYTKALKKVAGDKRLAFIDLYTPSSEHYKKQSSPITINGIHLNEDGYRKVAGWMAAALGFTTRNTDLTTAANQKLLKVVKMKDDHFFYRWRAVNGEYIYGRRREPFGVIAFPPELRKLNEMAAALDSVIWAMGNGNTNAFGKAAAIVDRRGKPADPSLVPSIRMQGRQSSAVETAHQHHKTASTATTSFRLPEGYEINLFASEKDFPIEKPVSMNFDAKGRLWVATMPTYPQYFPGIPVHDKIVILEDTNGDGVADKHTVFADNLYLPLGFEFGNGGVYVSQEPDILFLKDTDGDDKADFREVILTGFGSEDSHHATHAFTFGQDGALYFNEGTFLNSQIETPYGPVRCYSGATYRYEPRTGKLEAYISYPYYNPWGSVFDRWGTHLIGDASDGSNYFAPPMTGKTDYPVKHPRMETFTETRVRPTAGIEIVSSRNFPNSVQGDFLVNNNIGFQGTKQHRIIPEGSGIRSKEVAPLLQSTDPNFRPIDLEFGPDGALYIVDWYNPLISHGENPPRDPARDKSHGRIWRITYKSRPLNKNLNLSTLSIPRLLDLLKEPDDRLRYRARYVLRIQKATNFLPELANWVKRLDPKDPGYEHQLLEALWLYQDFNTVEIPLLKRMLTAKRPEARAAATRVLRYWKDKVPDAVQLMRLQANDPSSRIRLEAAVALSFFNSLAAVEAVTDILKYPTDHHLNYALRETFQYLKPIWISELKQQNNRYLTHPIAFSYLLGTLNEQELMTLPGNTALYQSILARPGIGIASKKYALAMLLKSGETRSNILLAALKTNQVPSADLVGLLLASDPKELSANKAQWLSILADPSTPHLSAVGYASLITAEGNDKSVWTQAQQSNTSLHNYLQGVSLLQKSDLQASLYDKVKSLLNTPPGVLTASYQDLAKSGVLSSYYPVYAQASEILLSSPGHTQDKGLILKNWIKQVSQTPIDHQNSPDFVGATRQVTKLSDLAPADEKAEILTAVRRMGAVQLKLVALEAKMAYDKISLTVPAGRQVSLLFENPDLMPHNIVITKRGSEERVGQAADAMAALSDGFEKNFVPATPDVLFSTPLVNPGKSFRLNFKAPEEPGAYPYICSFPGHWLVMKGTLIITKPE